MDDHAFEVKFDGAAELVLALEPAAGKVTESQLAAASAALDEVAAARSREARSTPPDDGDARERDGNLAAL